MQLYSLTSAIALFALATSAAAAPGSPPALAPRQFYDGPCSTSNCGAGGTVCSSGYICVRYPSITEPQGCTCSLG